MEKYCSVPLSQNYLSFHCFVERRDLRYKAKVMLYLFIYQYYYLKLTFSEKFFGYKFIDKQTVYY